MGLKKSLWFLVIFNIIYITIFAIYYISIKNYEFLWYVGVLVFFFLLIIMTINKSKFNHTVLWGLSIWGLLHMAGGGIIINGNVLYALKLIPIINIENIFILRYDQLVHFFGFGVSTLVGYFLLKPYLNNKVNYKIIYPLLVAVGMGLGALNETIEFVAVVFLKRTGVGGYYNTSLDLVFNLLGAIAAVVFIHFKYRKQLDNGIKIK